MIRVYRESDAAADPKAAAREAGLRYVDDRRPGITRRRRGPHFAYFRPDGRLLADRKEIARIRALAVPPAYTHVWICPLSNGHLQATGRDARGRKQYRYHRRWREFRDEAKYHRLVAFGRKLPAIRARVARDLAEPGITRGKVVAALVALLDMTGMRVGNEEYASANGSFGLTTLRTRHVRVGRSEVRFRFRGKTGREHLITLEDPRLARIIKRCRDLPGEELFTYVDGEGSITSVSSDDVNEYIREVAQADFSAKDFRTWIGTVQCVAALREAAADAIHAKHNVTTALECVARRLGNTAAVCRKAYVHPAVLSTYLRDLRLPRIRSRERGSASALASLSPTERHVFKFIEWSERATPLAR